MNPTCGFPQVTMYKGSTLYWLSDPWRWQTRKHGCGWEGAAPKSDTGRGVQHGCLRISAAFELFFFFPSDLRQLGSIHASLASIHTYSRRTGLIRPKSGRIGHIGSYRLAIETAETGRNRP